MEYTIRINPDETSNRYGVDSKSGYEIKSETHIFTDEVAKIQAILAAFVELQLAHVNMMTEDKEFHKNVANKPEEEWSSDPKYGIYTLARERLFSAEEALISIKMTHNVKSITPL